MPNIWIAGFAMTDWQNIPDDIEQYQGFIYLIKRKDGKYGYIGKKNFWKIVKYKPLKGRKNKRYKKRETDWKSYWSSNTFLQKEVERLGEDKFERVILLVCDSKAMMSYFELYFQMRHRVLFSDYWLNGIINVRIGANSIQGHSKKCSEILNQIEKSVK
jgi:hypothetical protein